jgi:hypothetical protein
MRKASRGDTPTTFIRVGHDDGGGTVAAMVTPLGSTGGGGWEVVTRARLGLFLALGDVARDPRG